MSISLKATYVWTLYEKENFRVVRYKSDDPVALPDGRKVHLFNASGTMCPVFKGVSFLLSGEFKEYKDKKTGKTEYDFILSGYEEILPTEKDGLIAYLKTLDGIGEKTAKALFDYFSYTVFSVIEKDPDRLTAVKGISKAKAQRIAASFLQRNSHKDLFEYLFKYNVSESVIMKLADAIGRDALSKVKDNPFILTDYGVSFYSADYISKKEGLGETDEKRICAAIIEVLKQSENGGSLFGYKPTYPDFVYDRFLRKPVFDYLSSDISDTYGSTYIPYPLLYLKFLKLLNEPVPEDDFKKALVLLKIKGRVFYEKKACIDDVAVFLKSTYEAECTSTHILKTLATRNPLPISDLKSRIREAESKETIRLSIEQKNAVISSLSSSVSIITGGPGTGKSSIIKIIIDVFKGAYPEKRIVLASPTGQAAKRMHDVSGIDACTIHSLLKLRPEEDAVTYVDIRDSLIIIDETSMIGTKLLAALLSAVGKGSQIIFVGDADQLPSVEVGSCLKEMLSSEIIPSVRLTQTFRTKDGSTIALNAARIRNGETLLEQSDDFVFIEEPDDNRIVDIVKELYKENVDTYGIDNVIVLSPFYKNTVSGVKSLNEILRKEIRSDFTEMKHFSKLGVTYYEGDRIMFTHNQGELLNGDLGYIEKIYFSNGKPEVIASFNDNKVDFYEDDLNYIRLAYSQTVHKSQGLEYPVVILILSEKHSILLNNPLVYTGITRAKQKCICVGSKDSLDKAIKNRDTSQRRSRLMA